MLASDDGWCYDHVPRRWIAVLEGERLEEEEEEETPTTPFRRPERITTATATASMSASASVEMPAMRLRVATGAPTAVVAARGGFGMSGPMAMGTQTRSVRV